MAKPYRKRSKLSGAFGLLRPLNTLFAMICVYIGLVFNGDLERYWPLAIAIAAFIFSGGNALNDVLDSEIDRKAHPSRPIPSGSIPRRTALKIGIVLFSLGISLSICAILLGYTVPGAIAIACAATLLLYNMLLKRTPLAGNLSIGLLGGAIFIFAGSFAVIDTKHFFAAAFAFLFHTSREIVKDIADLDTEEAMQIRTLPAVIGPKRSAIFASIFLLAIVPVTLLAYFTGVFSLWFLGSVVLFADLPIILFAWMLPQSITSRRATKIASDLKWIMAGGLFALYLGGITV